MKTFEKKWTSLMKKLSLTLSSLAIVILFSFTFSYSDENNIIKGKAIAVDGDTCLLYTSPSPRDGLLSRMPSSA